MSLKMYVLIRDDLTVAQQAVQAGHALAQFALDYPRTFSDWQEDSNTLIYLSIKNVDYWATLLEDGEFEYSVFHEPELKVLASDWDVRYWKTVEADTAIAVGPAFTSQYVLFKDLPLALQPKSETKRRWWQR